MKKVAFVLICISLVVSGLIVSGCSKKEVKSTINYQRRLQNYLPANTSSQAISRRINLSEEQKLRYDAKLGPSDLDFDIKIKNPY